MTFGSSWVMVCIDGLVLSARRACPPIAAGSRRGLTDGEPTELRRVWEAWRVYFDGSPSPASFAASCPIADQSSARHRERAVSVTDRGAGSPTASAREEFPPRRG